MEIRIRKGAIGVAIDYVYGSMTPYWDGTIHRLNSEMTKDLIRKEMRCRALSFRPTAQGRFILGFTNMLMGR